MLIDERKECKILIIGAGAAGLTCGSRLINQGEKDILIYTKGYGASPEIAGINFLTKDTEEERKLYYDDMMNVGYHINDSSLVDSMVNHSHDTLNFLLDLGVGFSKEDNGEYKKRHLSGHSTPRTLCNTEEFIGLTIMRVERKYIQDNNVGLNTGYECIHIKENSQGKFAYFMQKNKITEVKADFIVLAWGGIGELLGDSTYPKDVYGNTLGIGSDLALEFIDLEFLEYEPMVMLYPEKTKGEPCPTAMLGEGGYLVNKSGYRFLLDELETEAGAPKSIINSLIQREIDMGNGSEYDGVWADLRHIDVNVLKGYPWFYDKLMANGVDPNKELLNVGPMKHSLSGGIKVDRNYRVRNGIYAIGEAAGGVHGACRCAGNGGAQSVVSGFIAANAILSDTLSKEGYIIEMSDDLEYKMDLEVFKAIKEDLIEIGMEKFEYVKDLEQIEEAVNNLKDLLDREDIHKDTKSLQSINSAIMVLESALTREESVGTYVVN